MKKAETKELEKETKVTKKPAKKVATKKTAKKVDEKVEKKVTAKKTTIASKSTAKRTSARKTKSATKKATTAEKSATKKDTTSKKVSTSKKSTTTKKTTSRKRTVVKKTSTSKKEVAEKFENIVEYYDLPYAYNKTVVKVLYQNPTTLFVYWEISQDDVKHFQKEYGDNFFYITKPVLVVHNKTKDYTFELDINDFANNWYIHVDDAKCEYSVKLARRPNQSDVIYDYDNNRNTDFVEVSNSNVIEMPNDHVLFYEDDQKLYFKNLKTNKVTEKIYKFKSKDAKNVKAIYKNYKLDENDDRFDFRNPSSQNPTSNVVAFK